MTIGSSSHWVPMGEPDAIHVADRWHLIRNWTEVADRVIKRHPTYITKSSGDPFRLAEAADVEARRASPLLEY